MEPGVAGQERHRQRSGASMRFRPGDDSPGLPLQCMEIRSGAGVELRYDGRRRIEPTGGAGSYCDYDQSMYPESWPHKKTINNFLVGIVFGCPASAASKLGYTTNTSVLFGVFRTGTINSFSLQIYRYSHDISAVRSKWPHRRLTWFRSRGPRPSWRACAKGTSAARPTTSILL